jgi:hypothetical protein
MSQTEPPAGVPDEPVRRPPSLEFAMPESGLAKPAPSPQFLVQGTPLGLCNTCIVKRKTAETEGALLPQVNPAVTLVASTVQIPVPGGMATAVIALPACWFCIGVQKTSPLLQANGGMPG